MTSIRLFFNRGVILQDLRQHGWIGILYLLALSFLLPIVMMLQSMTDEQSREIDSLFDVSGGLTLNLLLIFPIFTVTFIFRYLHRKAPSDLYHSLPITRNQLLTSHLFSALILLLIPVWVVAVITALIRPLASYHYIYELSIVWEWALMSTAITLFLCGLTLLLAVSLGQTILQLIVTYGLLLTPAWLLVLGVVHLDRYLFGFSREYYERGYSTGFELGTISPFLRLTGLSSQPFGLRELLIYLLLGVVFIIISYFLYRKRDTAASGRAIVFPFMTLLFRLLVMLFISMVFGAYLFEDNRHSNGVSIFGYIIGGMLGCLIAEMVVRKTWLIWSKRILASSLGYGLLLLLLLYLPVSNIDGFEARVPKATDIKGVAVSNQFNNLIDMDMVNQMQVPAKLTSESFSHNPAYIEAVLQLHQDLVAQYEAGEITPVQASDHSRNLIIAYELESGNKWVREYVLQEGQLEDSLRRVMEHEEYKKQYVLKGLTDEDTFRATISSYGADKRVVITDPEDLQEFKQILLKEIMNMSYEEQLEMGNSWASIDLSSPNLPYGNYRSIDWSKSYEELEAWMEEKGLADQARITPSDIREMTITRNIANTGFTGNDDDLELENKYYEHMAQLSGEAKVTEEESLWDVLKNKTFFTVHSDDDLKTPYLVKMKLNSGEVLIEGMEHYPEGM